MKIKKELNFPVKVKAVLDEEGNLSLNVVATAPYGNRTASATLDTFPEDVQQAVSVALMDVLTKYAEQAVLLAEQEAVTAHSKAIALGEAV